ncbi:glycoside hydrolase family 5 protein [candidate division KSB1 bacterium]|nr:glycoside hydrolase family 5 protein [candidate division KSB1 bacterium]
MKKSVILLFAVIFVVVGVFCAKKSVKEPTLPQIKVEGNSFVDTDGNIIIFRGLALSDLHKLVEDGKWNKEHLQMAKDWGANVVRFAVHPLWLREHGHDAYYQLLDQGIAWAEELGMYAIIDWHSIGNLKDEKFFRDIYETTQLETFEFWEAMAKRYKGRTSVAFFEIFNEPTFFNGQLGSLTWDEWKVYNEKMIDIIYEIDNTKIPLVAGLGWGYLLNEVVNNPIDREGVAYVTHPYPQKVEPPWEEKWERDWGHVADIYPVFATEFGFMSKDEKGAHIPCISDENYGKRLVNYFTRKGVSWTVWCFDPDWAPTLITDWDYNLSLQGTFFKNVLQNRVFNFTDVE